MSWLQSIWPKSQENPDTTSEQGESKRSWLGQKFQAGWTDARTLTSLIGKVQNEGTISQVVELYASHLANTTSKLPRELKQKIKILDSHSQVSQFCFSIAQWACQKQFVAKLIVPGFEEQWLSSIHYILQRVLMNLAGNETIDPIKDKNHFLTKIFVTLIEVCLRHLEAFPTDQQILDYLQIQRDTQDYLKSVQQEYGERADISVTYPGFSISLSKQLKKHEQAHLDLCKQLMPLVEAIFSKAELHSDGFEFDKLVDELQERTASHDTRGTGLSTKVMEAGSLFLKKGVQYKAQELIDSGKVSIVEYLLALRIVAMSHNDDLVLTSSADSEEFYLDSEEEAVDPYYDLNVLKEAIEATSAAGIDRFFASLAIAENRAKTRALIESKLKAIGIEHLHSDWLDQLLVAASNSDNPAFHSIRHVIWYFIAPRLKQMAKVFLSHASSNEGDQPVSILEQMLIDGIQILKQHLLSPVLSQALRADVREYDRLGIQAEAYEIRQNQKKSKKSLLLLSNEEVIAVCNAAGFSAEKQKTLIESLKVQGEVRTDGEILGEFFRGSIGKSARIHQQRLFFKATGFGPLTKELLHATGLNDNNTLGYGVEAFFDPEQFRTKIVPPLLLDLYRMMVDSQVSLGETLETEKLIDLFILNLQNSREALDDELQPYEQLVEKALTGNELNPEGVKLLAHFLRSVSCNWFSALIEVSNGRKLHTDQELEVLSLIDDKNELPGLCRAYAKRLIKKGKKILISKLEAESMQEVAYKALSRTAEIEAYAHVFLSHTLQKILARLACVCPDRTPQGLMSNLFKTVTTRGETLLNQAHAKKFIALLQERIDIETLISEHSGDEELLDELITLKKENYLKLTKDATAIAIELLKMIGIESSSDLQLSLLPFGNHKAEETLFKRVLDAFPEILIDLALQTMHLDQTISTLHPLPESVRRRMPNLDQEALLPKLCKEMAIKICMKKLSHLPFRTRALVQKRATILFERGLSSLACSIPVQNGEENLLLLNVLKAILQVFEKFRNSSQLWETLQRAIDVRRDNLQEESKYLHKIIHFKMKPLARALLHAAGLSTEDFAVIAGDENNEIVKAMFLETIETALSSLLIDFYTVIAPQKIISLDQEKQLSQYVERQAFVEGANSTIISAIIAGFRYYSKNKESDQLAATFTLFLDQMQIHNVDREWFKQLFMALGGSEDPLLSQFILAIGRHLSPRFIEALQYFALSKQQENAGLIERVLLNGLHLLRKHLEGKKNEDSLRNDIYKYDLLGAMADAYDAREAYIQELYDAVEQEPSYNDKTDEEKEAIRIALRNTVKDLQGIEIISLLKQAKFDKKKLSLLTEALRLGQEELDEDKIGELLEDFFKGSRGEEARKLQDALFSCTNTNGELKSGFGKLAAELIEATGFQHDALIGLGSNHWVNPKDLREKFIPRFLLEAYRSVANLDLDRVENPVELSPLLDQFSSDLTNVPGTIDAAHLNALLQSVLKMDGDAAQLFSFAIRRIIAVWFANLNKALEKVEIAPNHMAEKVGNLGNQQQLKIVCVNLTKKVLESGKKKITKALLNDELQSGAFKALQECPEIEKFAEIYLSQVMQRILVKMACDCPDNNTNGLFANILKSATALLGEIRTLEHVPAHAVLKKIGIHKPTDLHLCALPCGNHKLEKAAWDLIEEKFPDLLRQICKDFEYQGILSDSELIGLDPIEGRIELEEDIGNISKNLISIVFHWIGDERNRVLLAYIFKDLIDEMGIEGVERSWLEGLFEKIGEGENQKRIKNEHGYEISPAKVADPTIMALWNYCQEILTPRLLGALERAALAIPDMQGSILERVINNLLLVVDDALHGAATKIKLNTAIRKYDDWTVLFEAYRWRNRFLKESRNVAFKDCDEQARNLTPNDLSVILVNGKYNAEKRQELLETIRNYPELCWEPENYQEDWKELLQQNFQAANDENLLIWFFRIPGFEYTRNKQKQVLTDSFGGLASQILELTGLNEDKGFSLPGGGESAESSYSLKPFREVLLPQILLNCYRDMSDYKGIDKVNGAIFAEITHENRKDIHLFLKSLSEVIASGTKSYLNENAVKIAGQINASLPSSTLNHPILLQKVIQGVTKTDVESSKILFSYVRRTLHSVLMQLFVKFGTIKPTVIAVKEPVEQPDLLRSESRFFNQVYEAFSPSKKIAPSTHTSKFYRHKPTLPEAVPIESEKPKQFDRLKIDFPAFIMKQIGILFQSERKRLEDEMLEYWELEKSLRREQKRKPLKWSEEKIHKKLEKALSRIFAPSAIKLIEFTGLKQENLYLPQGCQEMAWDAVTKRILPAILGHIYIDMTGWERSNESDAAALKPKLAHAPGFSKMLTEYLIKNIRSDFALNRTLKAKNLYPHLVAFFADFESEECDKFARYLRENKVEAKKLIEENLEAIFKADEMNGAFDAIEKYVEPLILRVVATFRDKLETAETNKKNILSKMVQKIIIITGKHVKAVTTVAFREGKNAEQIEPLIMLEGVMSDKELLEYIFLQNRADAARKYYETLLNKRQLSEPLEVFYSSGMEDIDSYYDDLCTKSKAGDAAAAIELGKWRGTEEFRKAFANYTQTSNDLAKLQKKFEAKGRNYHKIEQYWEAEKAFKETERAIALANKSWAQWWENKTGEGKEVLSVQVARRVNEQSRKQLEAARDEVYGRGAASHSLSSQKSKSSELLNYYSTVKYHELRKSIEGAKANLDEAEHHFSQKASLENQEYLKLAQKSYKTAEEALNEYCLKEYFIPLSDKLLKLAEFQQFESLPFTDLVSQKSKKNFLGYLKTNVAPVQLAQLIQNMSNRETKISILLAIVKKWNASATTEVAEEDEGAVDAPSLTAEEKKLDEECGAVVNQCIEMFPSDIVQIFYTLNIIKEKTIMDASGAKLGGFLRSRLQGKKLTNFYDEILEIIITSLVKGHWNEQGDYIPDAPYQPAMSSEEVEAQNSEKMRISVQNEEDLAAELATMQENEVKKYLKMQVLQPGRSFKKFVCESIDEFIGSQDQATADVMKNIFLWIVDCAYDLSSALVDFILRPIWGFISLVYFEPKAKAVLESGSMEIHGRLLIGVLNYCVEAIEKAVEASDVVEKGSGDEKVLGELMEIIVKGKKFLKDGLDGEEISEDEELFRNV